MLFLVNTFGVALNIFHDLGVSKAIFSMDAVDLNPHNNGYFATFINWSFFATDFKHFCSVINDLVKRGIASNTSQSNNVKVI